MNKEEFEKLCRQIADVPWIINLGTGFVLVAKYDQNIITVDTRQNYFSNTVAQNVVKMTGSGLDKLRIVFTDSPSVAQINTARAFFDNLDLKYVAHEFSKKAQWKFYGYYANIPGVEISRSGPRCWIIELRDYNGFVRSFCGESATELITEYREHRSKHDAKRGVKPLPTVATAIWPREWCPPEHDNSGRFNGITVEHARNIVTCMATPTKYTHIATWAKNHPLQAASILRRALEEK